ncbi:hypothetical protein HBA54_08370 [Pelagibius litoralis]|uniref:Uncharacterized protein n=1 Tax=Pelagibius litoralis TaxID=374515 RepID=A0A967C4N8_9PROT|nr:hypothetical protein [Pelagibius litoralis]NIA68604.1 hypothetical protein [Pelagibius litoralis]
MPTWLLVLLVMIPVLWLAFCILKAQFGLVCGRACSATILLADAVAIIWLAVQGQHFMNGAQIGFACLVLFTVNVGLSVGWLTGHLKLRREKDAVETSF